jgi:hypothetical protein
MYNGDRSSTLDKAVEYILQHNQGQQQDDVPARATATGRVSGTNYNDLYDGTTTRVSLTDILESVQYIYSPSPSNPRSG